MLRCPESPLLTEDVNPAEEKKTLENPIALVQTEARKLIVLSK